MGMQIASKHVLFASDSKSNYSDVTLVVDEQTPPTAHKISKALPVIQ